MYACKCEGLQTEIARIGHVQSHGVAGRGFLRGDSSYVEGPVKGVTMRGNYGAEGPFAFRGRLAMGTRERRDERFARQQPYTAGSGARGMFLLDKSDHWGNQLGITTAPARRGLRLATTSGH